MNDEELKERFEKLEGMVNVLLQQIRNIQEGRVVAPEEASSEPLAGAAPLLRPQARERNKPTTIGVIARDNEDRDRPQSPPTPPQSSVVREAPQQPAVNEMPAPAVQQPATSEPSVPSRPLEARGAPTAAPQPAMPQPAPPVIPPVQAAPRLPSSEPSRSDEQPEPARNESAYQQRNPRPVTMPAAETPQPAVPQLPPSPPPQVQSPPSPPQAPPSPVAPEVNSPAPTTPGRTAPPTMRFIGPAPEVEQPQYIEDHPSVRPLDSRVTWGGGEYVRHGEVFTPQQPPSPLQVEVPPQQPLPAPPARSDQPPVSQPSPPPPISPLPSPPPALQATPPPQVPQSQPPTSPVAATVQPPPQQPATIPAQIPVTSQAIPANPSPPEPTPQEQRQQRAAWRAEERRENIRSQGRQTNVDRMDEPYRAAYYDAAGVPEPPKSPAPRDALRAPRSGGDERLAEFAEVTASTLQIMQERLTLAMRQIEETRRLFEMAAHE